MQNRRHFLQALFTGAAGLTITWPAFSQTPGPSRITATKLTDRIAAVFGAGGNVGVLIGNDGLLEFTHTPLAHTDGDAFVFFPSANVLHTGDLLWTGRYPVVDYTVGGSLAVMAATLEQLEKVGDANTRIIPGHGTPGASKADMRQVREAWLAINQRLEDHA